MKPRSKIALLLVGTLASGTASAWTNSFDPTAGPVTIPGSNATTEVWKLAGRSAGFQIAPQWIMTAKHNIPHGVFTNSYGSANIGTCIMHPDAGSVSVDMAICPLLTPINLPAGQAFPILVEAPDSMNGVHGQLSRVTPQLGYFLVTGFGGDSGLQRAAWMDYMNVPASYSAVGGASNPSPAHTEGGDSGSPIFWFKSPTDTPAIPGITYHNVIIYGQKLFTLQTLNWLTSVMPTVGGVAPATSTAANYLPISKLSPPRMTTGSSFAIPSSTANGLTISWTRPPTQAQDDITAYNVILGRNDQLVSVHQVKESVSGQSTTTLNNLISAADYTVCVVPVNSTGMAQIGSVAPENVVINGIGHFNYISDPNCLAGYTSPSPDRVQNVQISKVSFVVMGQNYWTYKVQWDGVTTPSGVRVKQYRIGSTFDGAAEPVYYATGTSVRGQHVTQTGVHRICATVTAYGQSHIQGEIGIPVCKDLTF